MATTYKIEIKATSHWTNFTPERIAQNFRDYMEKTTNLENIEINVERVA
jgi:hypothetical protein